MGMGRSKSVTIPPHSSQVTPLRTRDRHPHFEDDFDDMPGIFHNLSALEMTRERLVISETEHYAARDYYSRLHYGCMIPYIVISAFLAVINVVLPSDTAKHQYLIRQASAMLNAFNAFLLGIGALMRFQSNMENHSQAAGQCAALKTECSQLDATLRMLVFGIRTHDTHKQLGDFLRTFAGKLSNLYSKHEEIEQMCPVSDYFGKIGTRRLAAMRSAEIKHAPMVLRHKDMVAEQAQNVTEVVKTLAPRSGAIRDDVSISTEGL